MAWRVTSTILSSSTRPLVDSHTGFVGRRAAAKEIQAKARCYLVRLRIKGTRAQHAAAERIQRWIRCFLEECHAWRAANRQLLKLLLNRVRILLPFTSVDRDMEVPRTSTNLGRWAKPSAKTLSSTTAASDLMVLSTSVMRRERTFLSNRFLQCRGLGSAQLLATQIVTDTSLIPPRWSASTLANGKFLSAGCEAQYPGQFSLQLVTVSSASSPVPVDSCSSVTVHWCGNTQQQSGSPYLMHVGLDSPEWHRFVILSCDAARKPKYFGPSAKKSLLRFILHKRMLCTRHWLSHITTISPDALLSSLGARTTFSVTAGHQLNPKPVGRDTQGGYRHASITVLLSIQTLRRAEAQNVASNILFDLLEDLIHMIPRISIHIGCTVSQYQAQSKGLGAWTTSCRQRGAWTRLSWNGCVAGDLQVPMRDHPSHSVMMRNEGLPCAVGHFILTGNSASSIQTKNSDGSGGVDNQKKFLLQIELSRSVGGRPCGVAILNERFFDCIRPQRNISVFVKSSVSSKFPQTSAMSLGYVCMRLTARRLETPHWRQRLQIVKSYVGTMIKSVLSSASQPRIEISLERLTGLLPEVDVASLECWVTWGGHLATTWFAASESACEACISSPGVRLNLPAHGLIMPVLKLEILGTSFSSSSMDTTRKTCFGVCSVNGHELTNHAGRVELNFVEPLKPFSANSSQIDQVARLVPGRVVMFVEVFDAPFGAQSPEHADTTRLQLSILDLDMTGCKSSLVSSHLTVFDPRLVFRR